MTKRKQSTRSNVKAAPSRTLDLSEHERDLIRNMRTDMPQLRLRDLSAITKVLLLAAGQTSVSVEQVGRVLRESDAYADYLLRSLCAANLMFINGDEGSLDGSFIKPISNCVDRIEQGINRD